MVPGPLLRRLVDEYPSEVLTHLTYRPEWTDEQFDALVDHPDTNVRAALAESTVLTTEQRLRFLDDPEFRVLYMLLEGAVEPLPEWAYRRLIERDARLRDAIAHSYRLPPELRERLSLAPREADEPAADVEQSPLDRAQAEALAGSDNEWDRFHAAADPRLPADLVAALATDPSPRVRLQVSMRPELTEEQRAAIDYRVEPQDRIHPARWAAETRDPEQQRRCVYSAHIGLRRSVAYNPALPADLIAVLAEDGDYAVRLLLCENHETVSSQTVLRAYLEGQHLTRSQLLHHPAFERIGLARLADDPDPQARCLVVMDPEAPPHLVERLSHDPHPFVRRAVAGDPRLSPDRVLALLEEPVAAERAAASPHLPVSIMERVAVDAATLKDEQVDGTPRVYLGNWKPDQLPDDD
ncbi:hypothetical protein [Phytohabitans houttuyneae]|uniref:Leucine rich repeat variant n=1 Tax=Phytohabitans houttuyneae TaxID=1076126 RepID=A0A6V8KEW1_9ACTN|nr:hypothetical protein [Phytohabitans houttuyneae]GFJ80888.1 hypothetical protein Phou_050680 [Phytohabitans houttuyneae]